MHPPSTHSDLFQRTMSSARPLDARTSYQVSSALNELSEFLITANERETKNRQKLLRNLRVSHQESDSVQANVVGCTAHVVLAIDGFLW